MAKSLLVEEEQRRSTMTNRNSSRFYRRSPNTDGKLRDSFHPDRTQLDFPPSPCSPGISDTASLAFTLRTTPCRELSRTEPSEALLPKSTRISEPLSSLPLNHDEGKASSTRGLDRTSLTNLRGYTRVGTGAPASRRRRMTFGLRHFTTPAAHVTSRTSNHSAFHN